MALMLGADEDEAMEDVIVADDNELMEGIDDAKDTKDTDEKDKTKATIQKVLQETGFAETRAAKMSIDDFLRLLAAFNEADLHFC